MANGKISTADSTHEDLYVGISEATAADQAAETILSIGWAR